MLGLGCGSSRVVSGLSAAMLLNYHIGCIVLGLLCVGVRVRFV